MKQSLNMTELGAIIRKFLKRFHVMLYTLTVLVGLALAILLLSQVLGTASDTSAAPVSSSPSQFDTNTMKQVESLNRANEGKDIQFPKGRVNPFVE